MIGFLAFSVRRAFQGLLRNAVMSLAATITMVLMLLLLAGLVIILSGLQAGLAFVEQKVEVQAFLNDGVSRERVDALIADVESLPEVADVTYTSKEQALAEWREQLKAQGKQDLTAVTGTNPIPAKLNVKLKDPQVHGQVAEKLKAPPGVVQEVVETRKVADAIITITDVLRTVGLAIMAMVGLTVLFIVVNTIRMAVMARADEIEIMRLVGASDAFIRWPFIFEGLLVGLLGAGVTLGVLALGAQPISQLTNVLVSQVPIGFDDRLGTQLLLLVLAAGTALGGFGAWISVRTYLIK
ncbi:MAG TPA: permease-like cell division protein FtsX [Candidatus Limnocylindrales bacterium]|nr:permease-like cell division protein FtsX [Candidatus Limnocylindrales bacterium]